MICVEKESRVGLGSAGKNTIHGRLGTSAMKTERGELWDFPFLVNGIKLKL